MADKESNNGGGCGEIVEVEGGHIVRSTGKKDRHSKVCTAKGPRDRRVRLSAPTAIQFYDVQDRLGFDRPSKAVDWLIKKAKSSIDDLAQLPPWNPADTLRQAASNAKPKRSKTLPATGTEHHHHQHHHHHHQQQQSSYLPASMDSDSIADTIKSFFPVVSTETTPPQHQPRGNTQSQDLRLSLQSTEHALFSGQHALFDESTAATSWEQSQEVGRMQRLVTWNNVGAGDSGGFVFASPATTTTTFQAGYGQQSQVFSQRGPLQSINTPMIRAWFDPHHHQSISTDDDLHLHHHHNHVPTVVHQSAIPGIAFASSGEFSGFRSIPARFHGEHDHHGDKPLSDSRH